MTSAAPTVLSLHRGSIPRSRLPIGLPRRGAGARHQLQLPPRGAAGFHGRATSRKRLAGASLRRDGQETVIWTRASCSKRRPSRARFILYIAQVCAELAAERLTLAELPHGNVRSSLRSLSYTPGQGGGERSANCTSLKRSGEAGHFISCHRRDRRRRPTQVR